MSVEKIIRIVSSLTRRRGLPFSVSSLLFSLALSFLHLSASTYRRQSTAMVGTRSPGDEEDAGPSSALGAASPTTEKRCINEATLDALVVEWLREEGEKEKVRRFALLLRLASSRAR